MDLTEIRRIEYQGLTFRTLGWMDEESNRIVIKEVKALVRAWLESLTPGEEKTDAGVGYAQRAGLPLRVGNATGKPQRAFERKARRGVCDI